MDANGSNPMQLTTGDGEATPFISSDGRWVYYTKYSTAHPAIEKISIDGGEAAMVPNVYASSDPVISPDGRQIAYEHYDDANGWHTALMRAEGNYAPKLLSFHAFRGAVRWAHDGQALIYADAHEPDNLWRQPLTGNARKQFTFFKEAHIAYFDISQDGKQLAVARGDVYSDDVLITNFR